MRYEMWCLICFVYTYSWHVKKSNMYYRSHLNCTLNVRCCMLCIMSSMLFTIWHLHITNHMFESMRYTLHIFKQTLLNVYCILDCRVYAFEKVQYYMQHIVNLIVLAFSSTLYIVYLHEK